jgi:hypothetical protein
MTPKQTSFPSFMTMNGMAGIFIRGRRQRRESFATITVRYPESDGGQEIDGHPQCRTLT